MVFCQNFNFANILFNSSFEDGTDNSKPNYVAQTEFLQFWKDNLKKIIEPNSVSYLHSPDWFKEGYGFIDMVEYNPYPQQIHVQANNGTGYIGMGYAELIMQQLSNDNKFQEGLKYYLSMYIRPIVYPVYSYNGYFGYANWNNFVNLKVYAAKKDIIYKNNKIEDICTAEYDDFQDGIFQSIINIADFSISLNNYQPGMWHKISTNFIAPNESFDWIAIEIDEQPSFCDAYILIDDVMIAEGCINGCSSTAGVFDIVVNEKHEKDDPLTFFGLKNITYVELTIKWLQSDIITIIINNPPNIIAWDGKNANGVEVDAANVGYQYLLKVTNDCGTKEYNENFQKLNHSGDPTNPSEYFYFTEVSKPPLPECCQEYIVLQNQYLVQDKTIGAPDPLLYKADIGISAGPVVIIEEDNTVIFEAGQAIDLLPGFTVEQGASFTATITSCDGNSNKSMMLESENTWQYNEYSDLLETTKFEQQESYSESNFTIHPNPFSDSFTISFSQPEETDAKIYLTDAYGRQVLGIFNGSFDKGQHSIDVSTDGITKGLYFCVMETPAGRNVVKVIKTE